jgi:hypothetical protein
MFTCLPLYKMQNHNKIMCLYSATIRKLEVAAFQARDDLLQLQESLCTTSIGKLSIKLTLLHILHIF